MAGAADPDEIVAGQPYGRAFGIVLGTYNAAGCAPLYRRHNEFDINLVRQSPLWCGRSACQATGMSMAWGLSASSCTGNAGPCGRSWTAVI